MAQVAALAAQATFLPAIAEPVVHDLHAEELQATLGALCALASATAAAVVTLDHDGTGILASSPAIVDPLPLRSLVEQHARVHRSATIMLASDGVAVPVMTLGEVSLWVALQFMPGEPATLDRIQTVEEAARIILSAQIEAAMQAGEAQRHAAALAAALDQGECGVIIVRHDRSVLYSNSAAQEILATRDGLELRRGVPRPIEYHDAIRFREALDCVIAPPRERSRRIDQGGMVMLLDRIGDERPLIAVLAPAHASPHAGEDQQAAAVIYVTRPERSIARGLDPICHLHGLSPVETLLVGHLMAGLTVSEAAVEMRVKPDTARAYLKQVFAKTDTHRQSELLQLFVRYQRAVRGNFAFKAA